MDVSRRTTFLAVSLVLVLVLVVGLSLYIAFQPIAGAGLTGAAGVRQSDPAYSYVLSCDGSNIRAIFQSMQGPGVSNEAVTSRTVGDRGREVVRIVPGQLNFQALVLKRTLSNESSLWLWRRQMTDGQIDPARQGCSIRVVDAKASVLAEWNLVDAWPMAYEVEMTTGTDVETNTPIEVLTVMYDGLIRTK